jgi:hypothetical protein
MLKLFLAIALIPTLSAAPAMAQTTVTRGPYLQMPGSDRMTVVFHTDVALTTAEVDYGTTTALGTVVAGTSSADLLGGFKHVVELTGLTADTKFFYAVGDNGSSITTPGDDYAFITSPVPGTRQPIRIWTYGDSGYWPGSSGTEYMDTRLAYYDHVGGGDVNAAADATDVHLYLGDNAYTVGDDSTYQSRFFAPPELAAYHQRQPFFSAMGNHEGFGNNSLNESGAYFDMFYFPTANELGANGVASGSESYYSFDYGNIHFIILDSEDVLESVDSLGAPMVTWLENDLLATDADWIIVAWHRPPYSKGQFHDSDVENNEVEARETFNPILESYGVDVVLSAHSHTYERSYLIDGYYGLEDSLTPANLLDAGDGDPLGNGPYRKPSFQQAPNEGAVYIVSGSAADLRSFVPAEGHKVHQKSLLSLGTSILEVDGDTMTGKFLDDSGVVLDSFRIEKGTGGCDPAPLTGCTAAGKGKMVVKDDALADKDQVQLKWTKTNVSSTGMDPVAGTDLIACVYDDTGLVYDLRPPNPERYATSFQFATPKPSWSWSSKKPGLFGYDDKQSSVEGLSKIKMKVSEKGLVQLKAKGGTIAPPALPLTGAVVSQFINWDSGDCYSVTLETKKNDGAKLIASGP